MTNDPLVWLPFDPELLGDVPSNLRYEHIDPDHLPESADEVEFYVLAYRFRAADGEALATLPKLRVVQTLTAGVEHVRPYLPEGVPLCNGRGIHDTSTAELTVALILASLRGIPEFVRAQERAEWASERRESLADKRVLIVGYGQIGEAIERRIETFEAEVTRVARSARDGVHAIDELPDLLPDADVVVLIVPGTDETTRALRRPDAGPDEGRRAARERLPRPGRRHRRPAGGAAEPAHPRRPRRRRSRAAARRSTRCGRPPTCSSCRTSAATAPPCGRGPTSWSASSSSGSPLVSSSRT